MDQKKRGNVQLGGSPVRMSAFRGLGKDVAHGPAFVAFLELERHET